VILPSDTVITAVLPSLAVQAAARVIALPGPQGAPGVTPHETYTPSAPASTWTYTHALGRIPQVSVWIDGRRVEADIDASDTTVTVTFATPATGVLLLT
jgi:hypothetical protein